jgi:conjugal transfer pilus assembly protein TraV
MSRREAIRLWHDLVSQFGPPQGRLLALELASCVGALGPARRAMLRRAKTHCLASGLAVWRLAVRLGMLAEHRAPSGLARASVAAVGLAATQLAACTSLFGGNIKGKLCLQRAGRDLRPSTLIDDQALSVIQNARPMTPAGPYMRIRRQPRRHGVLRAVRFRSIAAAGDGMVHRERRVLKVVFPSFVDGGGNLHEPRIVHAVVDDGAWMQLSSGEPNLGDQVEGRAVGLASAA